MEELSEEGNAKEKQKGVIVIVATESESNIRIQESWAIEICEHGIPLWQHYLQYYKNVDLDIEFVYLLDRSAIRIIVAVHSTQCCQLEIKN